MAMRAVKKRSGNETSTCAAPRGSHTVGRRGRTALARAARPPSGGVAHDGGARPGRRAAAHAAAVAHEGAGRCARHAPREAAGVVVGPVTRPAALERGAEGLEPQPAAAPLELEEQKLMYDGHAGGPLCGLRQLGCEDDPTVAASSARVEAMTGEAWGAEGRKSGVPASSRSLRSVNPTHG